MPSTKPNPLSNTSVPSSAMPLISPNALLHAHLKQNPPRRPSNRAPSDFRPIQLNVGSLTHCNGSSLVKIGATTIVCGVRAEILPVSEIPSFRVKKTSSRYNSEVPVGRGNPDEDGSGEEEDYSAIPLYHLVVPNIELATGCSPKHPANTPPSVEAQSISQRLLSLLHSSQLVRTSDLEIIYTPPAESRDQDLGINGDPELKAYWTLYIDMMCISHGGSIFDAAWLALHAALKDSLIPKAWWDADLEQVICSPDVDDAKKLRLRGMPVPSSWGAFVPEKRLLSSLSSSSDKDSQTQEDGDQSWILMDADSFEEESCMETGCVAIDCSTSAGRATKDAISILRIEKNGGSVVGAEQIAEITNIARRRWQQWKDVLDKALTSS